jgi:hypothetical protein
VADAFPGSDDARRPEPARPSTPAPQPKQKRARTPQATLNTALLAYAAVNGLSGLAITLFPRFFWETFGSADGDFVRALDSTRFGGAALFALAIGALLVLRRPAGQQTLVTVFALEATFVTAALIANVFVDDTVTGLLFDWVMLLGCAAVAGYLWLARFKARRILKERA